MRKILGYIAVGSVICLGAVFISAGVYGPSPSNAHPIEAFRSDWNNLHNREEKREPEGGRELEEHYHTKASPKGSVHYQEETRHRTKIHKERLRN